MGVSKSDGEVPKKPTIRIDCSGNHTKSMSAADIYCRSRGDNANNLCGTDKYGTATETKAMEEKCSPKEIFHKEVYKSSDVVFDESGPIRTQQQSEDSQAILNKPLKNNFLSENTMQQVSDTSFARADLHAKRDSKLLSDSIKFRDPVLSFIAKLSDANALNVEEDDVDELPARLPSVHGLSGSNLSSFGKESVHSDENDSPLADLSNLPFYPGSSTPGAQQFNDISDWLTFPADEVSRTEPQPSLRAPGSSQQLSGGPEIGACSLFEGGEAVRPTGKTLKAIRCAMLPGPVSGRGPVQRPKKDLDAMRCAKLPGPVRIGGMGGNGKDMNLLLRMKPQTPESQDSSPSVTSSSPGDVDFERVEDQWIDWANGDRVRVTLYKCSQDGCRAKRMRLTDHEADASSIKSPDSIYLGTHEH